MNFLMVLIAIFCLETSATLIDYNYQTLVMKLEELLKNPKIIEKQIEIGRTALEKLSWGKYSL